MFSFDNLFVDYNPILSQVINRIKDNIVIIDDNNNDDSEEDSNNFNYFDYIFNPIQTFSNPQIETTINQNNNFSNQESDSKSNTSKKDTTQTKFSEVKSDSALLKLDIEDLLRQEGITSVNGKKIKFGNKGLRPANASYGAKNSNHKKRDPHTGNAMARDISIIGGTTADYAEFRRILLNNPRVRAWMQTKGWGIINEVTSAILKRTRGTGPHFHFGPDRWAKRTWAGWLNNPNISITTAL